jgi:hypothetical protein
VFTDEPGAKRIVWLFSMVLGYSRLIWAHFVVHQDMQSVLRCHISALEAIGGAPREILYDRMKTAVIGFYGDVFIRRLHGHPGSSDRTANTMAKCTYGETPYGETHRLDPAGLP